MTANRNDDFCKLTFSQRENKAPLPEAMKLEHVPKKFRQWTWLTVDTAIEKSSRSHNFSYNIIKDIPYIIRQFKFHVHELPHDKIARPDPKSDKNFCRTIILGKDYHEVMTFVEYILRHEHCSRELYDALVDAFERTSIAYFVEEINGKPTIMPRISREAGEATRRAVKTISEGGMEGASSHLDQAADHINARQYADSIADSIHAVESVARRIDPKASNTLGPALYSLEKSGLLKHPRLKKGFGALYDYTNDEEGVRHSLVFKETADVGLDEAIFMFGACASFAAYLTQKHRQAGGA